MEIEWLLMGPMLLLAASMLHHFSAFCKEKGMSPKLFVSIYKYKTFRLLVIHNKKGKIPKGPCWLILNSKINEQK